MRRGCCGSRRLRGAHDRGRGGGRTGGGAGEDAIYLEHGMVGINGTTALAPAGLLAQFGGVGRHVDRSGLWLSTARCVGVDPTTGMILSAPQLSEVPADAIEALRRILPSGGA